MTKKKVNEATNQPESKKAKKPIWEDPVIIWDRPLIAETVIMTILAVTFIAAGFFLYFYDLSFLADATKEVGKFFSSPGDVESTIKPFCAPLIISGLSYLLFFSYRVMELDGSKWFHALLNLLYLGLVAGILYFNWYNCESWFAYTAKTDGVMGQVIRYIMWANSVTCGVFFLLYYSILVHVREWSKPWDIVMTIFMMTFIPVVIIVGFVVASIGAVYSAIMLPGKLIQKSVDSDLAARGSSGRQAYTVRNESGYEETVYSDNGSDFYGSDGSYAGHSDDGGKHIS